jgi:hypothetical protein
VMTLVLVYGIHGVRPNSDAYGFRYWRNPVPVNEYLFTGASDTLYASVATITFSSEITISDLGFCINLSRSLYFCLRTGTASCYW